MPSISAGNSIQSGTPKSTFSAQQNDPAPASQRSQDLDRPSAKSLNLGRKNGRSVGTPTSSPSALQDDVNQAQQSLNQTHSNEGSEVTIGDQLPKKTKKKSSSVVGFLTLKEPSTKALEEFAAAERERAKQRGGPTGVSSQKLPDHVPKVNSKWDGMPDSAKRSSHDTKRSTPCPRDSTLSTWTTQSGWDEGLLSPQNQRDERKHPSESPHRTTSTDQSSLSYPASRSHVPRSYSELEALLELSPFPSISSTGVGDAKDPKSIDIGTTMTRDANTTLPTKLSEDVYYTRPPLEKMDSLMSGSSDQARTSDEKDFTQPTAVITKEITSSPQPRKPPQVVNFSRPFSRDK